MTYRRCERCRGKIPLRITTFEITGVTGLSHRSTVILCRRCFERAKGWQAKEPNSYRHVAMMVMRDEFKFTLQQIGMAFGVDHSSVLHHLSGHCRCDTGVVA